MSEARRANEVHHATPYRRRWACTLIAAFALLAAQGPEPLAASAKEPKVTLAGVGFGMTPDEVRGTLGKPRRVSRLRSTGSVYRVVWHYRDRLTVEFAPYRSGAREGKPRIVASVTSHSPKDEVKPGIGVGSKLAEVKKLKPLFCAPYGRGDYLCLWTITRDNHPCGPQIELLFRDKRARVVEVALQAETYEGCDRP